MSKPACFPTQKLFDQWKLLAKWSNEDVHPCEDCTPEFKQRVGLHCETNKVQVIFLVAGRSTLLAEQKAKRDDEKEKKAEYDRSRADRINAMRRLRRLKPARK